MRALSLLAVTLTLGALAMSEQATAQEKKKRKYPSSSDPASYTERLTIRQWDGKKFINPIKDVPAFFIEVDGKTRAWIKTAGKLAGVPKGSELTNQKSGEVWVVTVTKPANPLYLVYVEKKEPAKKP